MRIALSLTERAFCLPKIGVRLFLSLFNNEREIGVMTSS